MPNIVIDVAGEAAGSPGVAREFAYEKIDPTPPLVTLTIDDNSGITQWLWSILDQPDGASATLSNPTTNTATFTPDAAIPGTYLIQCQFNGGASYARNAVAWTTKNLTIRIPAAGEAGEFSTTKGWALALRELIEIVDAGNTGGVRKEAVKSIVDCTAAPPTEVTGDRYILDFTGGSVHANWDGASKGDIVEFNGSVWVANTPEEGWVAYVDDVNKDAVYVDDPSPAWVYAAAGLWEYGGGTSAIKRIDNTTGTAAGARAINAGWGGAAAANDSFVGGNACIVTAGSLYSAVFGDSNTIGATNASPHSFVAGDQNTVDGDSSNKEGNNCVVGLLHDIAGDYNAVFGRDNAVSSDYCIVSGRGNDVSNIYCAVFAINSNIDSPYCLVAGNNHAVGVNYGSQYSLIVGFTIDVDGSTANQYGYNCLVGNTLTINADYVICHGYGHNVDSDYCAVFCSNNTVGGTKASPYSLVAGKNNNVQGNPTNEDGYNCVSGFSHDIDADYCFASGKDGLISADYGVSIGQYCDVVEEYGQATGYGSKSRWFNQISHSGYTQSTSTPGQSQNMINLSLSGSHLGSPAYWQQLRPDGHGGSKDLEIQLNTAHYFHYLVVAIKRGQDTSEQIKTWYGRFYAFRDSGGVTFGSSGVSDFSTSNGDEASWLLEVTFSGNNIIFRGQGSNDASDATDFQAYVYGPEVYADPT